MQTFVSYPYDGDPSYRKLRSFLVEGRRTAGHCASWHTGDLAWRLFLQAIDGDPRQNLQLWESTSGEVLGFTGYYLPRAFDLQVCLGCPAGLRDVMLDWVEMRWLEAAPQAPLVTDSGFFESDHEGINLLLSRGFQTTGNESVLMLYDLDKTVPDPVLPAGFQLRRVRGPEEAGERSAAHREAFTSERLTPERYLQLRGLPDFEPELDVVAVSPEGGVAAYALGWLDRDNAVGEFEPVGTRPAFRRLGLSRAVLYEGLRRMQRMGAQQAVVGPVEVELVPFYKSVGFYEIGKTLSFQKVPFGPA